MNVTPSGPQGQLTSAFGLSGRDCIVYHSGATAATYTMTTRTRTLLLTTTSSYGVAVTLPPVAEAAGLIFTITLVTRDTNDVTVDDAGDDTSQVQYTLDASGDRGIFFSDGVHWHNIIADSAAAT